MAVVMITPLARRATIVGASCLLLTACGKDPVRDLKGMKAQIQERFGNKDFAGGYDIAVKALDLARQTIGDKAPDTLYFAQAISENAEGMRNIPAFIKAMKVELDLRSKAGQGEDRLQRRRTLLIKFAEETGDKQTSIEQTVIIANSIGMGPGKDPQPTYRPESPYPADLARARSLYNSRQFDAAIEAASAAQKVSATMDAATVVLARAHLERYRERANPEDLAAARVALGTVRVTNLDPRDGVDLLMALGEALFFEDDYGAAASLFESAIDSAVAQGSETGEAMLDWWGSAVERHADSLERERRMRGFGRLRDRMARELARNPSSAAAAYWIVVGTRGTGEAVEAWDAAIAGWVRARLAGARSASLRADLDKLVLEGIIPDRVRVIGADKRAQAESDLRAEWTVVKERWK